jgi:wyosine [tRNA(Phe)-imidazoG37] synthetase (radical SAM superfamily)
MTQQDDSREILEAISQLKTDYEEKINDLNEIVEKFNINMNHTRAFRDKLNSITKEKNELDMILVYLNSQRHDSNKINVEDISKSESISDSAMYDSSRYASAESLDSIDTSLSAKSSKISDSLVFENNKTNS